jgi:hypothetical protein
MGKTTRNERARKTSKRSLAPSSERANEHLVVDLEPGESNDAREDERHPLHDLTRSYLGSLRNISDTAKIVLPHLLKWLKEEMAKTEKKIDRHLPEGSNTKKIYFESARDMVEFSSAMNQWNKLAEDKSLPLLLRSLFVQVFCEFDAFMGSLLKHIYSRQPDLLRSISREISLADLLSYDDIESASRAMLDKEIDTIRRDSYVEQFASLEKKFSLTLRKFPEWCEFVELTQRRNILVHNDALVSDQYLANCRKEGCQLESNVVIGKRLEVMPQDVMRLLLVMSKVGFMLGHTLWSKVFPQDMAKIHESLNATLYDCLQDKRWKVASELGDFSLTEPMRREVSEVDLKIRIVNTAIAKKFSGDEKGANSLLRSQDWTASYRDFKLAILVLEDKFDEAIVLMRQIGKSGEMLDQKAYHAWPLFEKFREREEFYAVYQEIYEAPYQAESNDVTAEIVSSKERGKPEAKVVARKKRDSP